MTAGQIETLVDDLVGGSTADSRAATAKRMAREFARHDLGPAQRTLAIDAFRLFIEDPDLAVRRTLSEGLRDDPMVPHDVIWRMANDVSDVALPILNHSIVLADDDLIDIVRTASQAHRLAIARRNSLSARVAHALCEVRNEAVALTLVRNPGADVDEAAFARLLADYTATSPVVEAAMEHQFLILRRSLAERSMSPTLAERLVHRIAAKLKEQVEAHPHLRMAASKLVGHASERATLALVTDSDDPAALRSFVRHLAANRRLTASLTMRGLVEGRFGLVSTALAFVSGFDEANVRSALELGQTGGLAVILRAARVPAQAAVAIETCVSAAMTVGYKGGSDGIEAFHDQILAAFGAGDTDCGALLKRLALAPVPLSPGANG